MDWYNIISSVLTAVLIAQIGKYAPAFMTNIKNAAHLSDTLTNIEVKQDLLSNKINDEHKERADEITKLAKNSVYISRIYLIIMHDKYIKEGSISYDDEKSYSDAYNSYQVVTALSGETNGIMEEYVNDIKNLPHKIIS
jgi:hypothetical protein